MIPVILPIGLNFLSLKFWGKTALNTFFFIGISTDLFLGTPLGFFSG